MIIDASAGPIPTCPCATDYSFGFHGNRSEDYNWNLLGLNGYRSYGYDMEHNLSKQDGFYRSGGTWYQYQETHAFDSRRRRVFKSFKTISTGVTSTWFYYYDPLDRLTEVRYTPITSLESAYQVFQLVWLGDRLVGYWQTDYPSTTTTKRYVGTDETHRPIDLWSWPASGDTTRVWAINPSAWGMDTLLTGAGIYQPVLFAGQHHDPESAAYLADGTTLHRPGLVWNRFRTYDPFTGAYLQVDPITDQTWNSYGYADTDPVGNSDPLGLSVCGVESCTEGTFGNRGDGGGYSYCSWGCKGVCEASRTLAFWCDCDACDVGDEGGISPPPPGPASVCSPAELQSGCWASLGDQGRYCVCQVGTGTSGDVNATDYCARYAVLGGWLVYEGVALALCAKSKTPEKCFLTLSLLSVAAPGLAKLCPDFKIPQRPTCWDGYTLVTRPSQDGTKQELICERRHY